MAKQPRKGKMKDAAEAMRGLVNDIRGDMGLPPLPQVLPPASTIWQGRTVAGAFEQLKHEAHYCLLSFLIDSAAEVEEYRRKQYRRLQGYRPELNDYMSALGNQRRELSGQWYHAGGSPHYGLTLTNLGAKSGPLTQRWERWAEGFAEEVRAAFVAHGQGEQAAKEVGRLASGIAHLSIGNAERTAYEARLERARQDLSNRGQYAAPGDIAAMFQRHIEGFNTWRVRLVERVGAVVATTTTTKPKPAKARPKPPSIAEKFAKVPGSLEKWMGLLRAKGLVDAEGRFAMAANAKGKGKLIAAWTAAQELFQLDGYATDKELVQALKDHIELTGLDRLDKVRSNKGFSDLVTEYKEDLEVD